MKEADDAFRLVRAPLAEADINRLARTDPAGEMMQVWRRSPIVLLNLALIAITMYRLGSYRSTAIDESPLRYGAQVDSASLSVLTQTGSLTNTNSTYLLLVFLADSDKNTPEAVAWLNRAVAARFNKIAIFAVVDTATSVGQYHLRPGGAIHAVYDDTGKLHSHFRIVPGHLHGGTVVVRRDGRVEFAIPRVLPADELRQMVEKYEVGSIHYAQAQSIVADSVPLGAEFPTIAVRPLDRGTAADVPLKGSDLGRSAVVLVALPCQSCQVAEVLKDVEVFSRRLAGENRRLWLLFVGGASVDTVDTLRSYPDWSKRAFAIDLRSLIGFGTETRFDDLVRPLVIYTDAQGRIERTAPLAFR